MAQLKSYTYYIDYNFVLLFFILANFGLFQTQNKTVNHQTALMSINFLRS